MRSYLKYLLIGFVTILPALSHAAVNGNLESFPLSQVTLHESPFKAAQQTDLEYMLSLKPDRLLAPYLREAGLEPKAEMYGNWESSGLGGHTAGHYLTALSMMYASTGNQEALDRVNYLVEELKRCQEANGNGYVGGVPDGQKMWTDIAAGNIDAEPFSLNGKWVPWYNLHKTYAGLRDAYLYAGNNQAREVLVGLSEWALELVSDLSDCQIQEMLKTEHGGMNEVFADVAVITGDNRFLELAERFSHREILNPLLQQRDSLTGLHANTQIPKVVGFKRIADTGGPREWNRAARFFWHTVVNNRTVAIGGNSVKEHFHPKDDFSSMIEERQGPETCNTYNMMRLSKLLYLSGGDLKYVNYYERAMYNHILSSQHPEKGGFVYFTPMRPRHYRVYSQPGKNFWCCVGSGMENHAKYGDLIYAHQADSVYVNLFIPSSLEWREKHVTLTQDTRFPESETDIIRIQTTQPTQFTVKIRRPAWVEEEGFSVGVNGKVLDVNPSPGTYVSVSRKWNTGDSVTIKLPKITRVEQLPDGMEYYAVLHGPLVLAAETDTTDLQGLFADDSRMGHVPDGALYPLEEAPMFASDPEDIESKIRPVEGAPLTFTAPGLITPAKYQDLKLVPFFRIHEARYMIYWPRVEP